jgi:hypothetical protein
MPTNLMIDSSVVWHRRIYVVMFIGDVGAQGWGADLTHGLIYSSVNKSFIFLLLHVLSTSLDEEPPKQAEYTGIIIHSSKSTI